MSITLGEKLRQAREARSISISEVAEQTRISPLYIKSIEEDNYKTLPGGIFNKGFVKSYAKYVGIDEQEALADYAALHGSQNASIEDEPKTYRPQVLTDDRNSSSGLRTIVLAAIILGAMALGILALMNYLQRNPIDETATNNMNAAMNANSSVPAANVDTASLVPNASSTGAPAMNDLRVELKAVGGNVSVSSTSDGKRNNALLLPGKSLNFEPKDNLSFSYAKTRAQNLQLTINGKEIVLPSEAANSKRSAIEVVITKDNLASIWQSGRISFDAGNAP